MTVFGSKVLKAYVILMWSGAVPWWGGGGGRRGTGHPPPPMIFFFFFSSSFHFFYFSFFFFFLHLFIFIIKKKTFVVVVASSEPSHVYWLHVFNLWSLPFVFKWLNVTHNVLTYILGHFHGKGCTLEINETHQKYLRWLPLFQFISCTYTILCWRNLHAKFHPKIPCNFYFMAHYVCKFDLFGVSFKFWQFLSKWQKRKSFTYI